MHLPGRGNFQQWHFRSLNFNFFKKEDKRIFRVELCVKRLTEAWFYYHLLKYNDEFQIGLILRPMNGLNEMLSDIQSEMKSNFIKKWCGEYHRRNCKHPKCFQLFNIDGNWKTKRIKCMNIDQEKVTSEQLVNIYLFLSI